MPRRPQPDLLDWQPPQPVQAFAAPEVRSSTLNGRITRAVAAALRGCELPREAVAAGMSEFLGRTVTKNMLDAYASEARDSHTIPLDRFLALVHVTQDRRLLELLAEPMGWAVIERRYLPLIDLATVREKHDDLQREMDALRRQARSGGLL